MAGILPLERLATTDSYFPDTLIYKAFQRGDTLFLLLPLLAGILPAYRNSSLSNH